MGVSIEFEFIYGSLANVNITARRLIELIEYLISSTYCTRFGRVYIRDFKIRQNGRTSDGSFLGNENLLLEMQQVRGELSHLKRGRITKNPALAFPGHENVPTPHYIIEITMFWVLSGFYQHFSQINTKNIFCDPPE